MLGHVQCMHELSYRAKEEFRRLCAKSVCFGGDTQHLLDCYRHNYISKDNLAATLRANQAVKDEVTTKRRDFANRFVQCRDTL